MSVTPQRGPRPMIVIFAVILLTLGMTVRFIPVFAGARVEKPTVYLIMAVVVGIPYFIIWLIFLGKNWARWVFLVVFGMALCSLATRFQELLSLPAKEVAAYIAQVLLFLVAAGALLSSTAVEWFRGKKNDT